MRLEQRPQCTEDPWQEVSTALSEVFQEVSSALSEACGRWQPMHFGHAGPSGSRL